MNFPRNTESFIRQVYDLLPPADVPTPEAFVKRLEQLQRGLEPENEFELILTWLGRCRLVHKLGQEQLPLNSTEEFRVPDILAAFEIGGRIVPVLIEVKTTTPRDLSLKPQYLPYAALLGLPMLVAWKCHDLWTLFEMRHAHLAEKNYKINFETAMKENLLGALAGDFSYRLVPGTRIRMRIRKVTQPDSETGGFNGEITGVEYVNSKGETVPSLRHLSSLFMFWDNEVELVDEGDYLVQSFVVQNAGYAEFASRTLSRIVKALSETRELPISWRSMVHDPLGLAHDSGRLRALVAEGVACGVITDILNYLPRSKPSFI